MRLQAVVQVRTFSVGRDPSELVRGSGSAQVSPTFCKFAIHLLAFRADLLSYLFARMEGNLKKVFAFTKKKKSNKGE